MVSFRAANINVVPGTSGGSADARSKTSMPALVAFGATNGIVASGATNGIVVPGTGACSADATSKTARSRPFSPARADVLPLLSDLLPSAP